MDFYRFKFILALVFLMLLSPSSRGEDDLKDRVEALNRRYDDFYHQRASEEQRLEKLNSGRGDRRSQIEMHNEMMEKARQQYVQMRRPKVDSSHEEARWDAEQKAKREEQELYRLRYVQSRDKVEGYLLKGRKIPDNEEYLLDEF